MSINSRVIHCRILCVLLSVLVVIQSDAQIAPFLASGSFLILAPGPFCETL